MTYLLCYLFGVVSTVAVGVLLIRLIGDGRPAEFRTGEKKR